MNLDVQVVGLARELLLTAFVIAGPIVLVGLVVVVGVSLVQALNSVQEQTLSLVPKMLAVFLVALLLLAPALALLRDFCLDVFAQLHGFGLS
jgi:flagellar biosynthetic protein FliQ